MSAILIRCPSCEVKGKIPPAFNGKLIRCPKCTTEFVANSGQNTLEEQPLFNGTEKRQEERRPVDDSFQIDLGFPFGTASIKNIASKGIGIHPLDSDYDLEVGQEISFKVTGHKFTSPQIKARVIRTDGSGSGCSFLKLANADKQTLLKQLAANNDKYKS